MLAAYCNVLKHRVRMNDEDMQPIYSPFCDRKKESTPN
jgi:hypothetical protein